MKQEQYQQHIEKASSILKELEKHSKHMATIRFIIFWGIPLFGYLGYQYTGYFYIGMGIVLVVFMYFVHKHDQIKKQLHYHKCEIEVVKHYLARFTNEWKTLGDDGSAYLQETFAPGYDLDIFGKASLYQYINVAATTLGKQRLADVLSKPHDVKFIKKQQGAIQELLDKDDFGIKVETLSYIANYKVASEDILHAFALLEKSKQPPSFMKYVRWILPCITLLCVIISIVYRELFIGVEIMVVLQLILAIVFHEQNKAYLQPVYILIESLYAYQQLFDVIAKETFEDPYLVSLKQAVASASAMMKQLSMVGGLAKMRLNFLSYLLVNGLLLWDFHCVSAFSKWCDTYHDIGVHYFEVIADMEMLLSLSMIGKVKKVVCMPSIVNDEVMLETRQVKHPLIQAEAAIANDFAIHHASCVITGSNMSGKTTFLRTLGLNTILAYAGTFVCASEYKVSLMHIFTSMRIEDDVSEGISTFYAELLRIKEIITFNRERQPMLVLIDEIFKGTNSRDRILGASETIRQLSNGNSITCVTTHDFELTSLQQDQDIHSVNYHFAEYYKDDKIYFDYKIKEGMATTSNAEYLLKMVGILSK